LLSPVKASGHEELTLVAELVAKLVVQEFPQNGLRIRWVVGSGAVFWVKQEWNWD